MLLACFMHTHRHTRRHARTHTHMHTHRCTRTHARMYAHTRTHAHKCLRVVFLQSYVQYFEEFAQIQLFQKSAANYSSMVLVKPDQEFTAWLARAPVLSDNERYICMYVVQPPLLRISFAVLPEKGVGEQGFSNRHFK